MQHVVGKPYTYKKVLPKSLIDSLIYLKNKDTLSILDSVNINGEWYRVFGED